MTVELDPPPRCRHCTGACLWYRMAPNEQLTLPASSELPIGAPVTVTLPDGYILLGATLLYGVPLAALLAGGASAAAVFDSDLAAAAGAAAALLVALPAALPLRRRLERATLRRLAVSLSS